jgi:hypothetical protein
MIAGNEVKEVKDSSMVKEPYKSQKRHESVRCYHSGMALTEVIDSDTYHITQSMRKDDGYVLMHYAGNRFNQTTHNGNIRFRTQADRSRCKRAG